MSIKATSSSTMVAFPDRQAITTYVNNHPLQKELDSLSVIESSFLDGVNKVAIYFAEKKMPSDSIGKNVRSALEEGEKKLAEVEGALKSFNLLFDMCKEGIPTAEEYEKKKNFHSKKGEPNLYFEAAVKYYEEILCDLLDNKTHAISLDSQEKKKRDVVDLTKRTT